MKVNFGMRTIEMTKKESKEAAKYGSDCYRELIDIKKDFPEFSVAIRELPRKRGVKNPTYQKMEVYVQKFGSDEQKKQFEDIRGAAKETMDESCNAYRVVKEWFDKNFPEAYDFAAAVARITAVA